ncbi:MAG: DUF192 domain-containing protein, partial [Lacunisphaera sp.]
RSLLARKAYKMQKMFSRCVGTRFGVLLSLLLLAACGGSHKATPSETDAIKSIEERFPIKVGDRVVQMQVVADEKEMERGLMDRKSMGADEGMLFVYDSPQQMNFWMHDTDIPLNIGFFDPSGELKEMYEMYPHDEETVSSHSRALQFALEMNQGWFARSGVKPGAKIDLKAVAQALKARGMDPVKFGLK